MYAEQLRHKRWKARERLRSMNAVVEFVTNSAQANVATASLYLGRQRFTGCGPLGLTAATLLW